MISLKGLYIFVLCLPVLPVSFTSLANSLHQFEDDSMVQVESLPLSTANIVITA